MARLPSVGGDNNDWGTVLNEYLSVSHTADGKNKPAVVSVAYSSSVTPDTDAAEVLSIGALTGNIGILNPSGTPIDGQLFAIRFIQDGTGGRSVTFGTAYVFETDSTPPVLPSAANAAWELSFRWNASSGKWHYAQLVSNDGISAASFSENGNVAATQEGEQVRLDLNWNFVVDNPDDIPDNPDALATRQYVLDNVSGDGGVSTWPILVVNHDGGSFGGGNPNYINIPAQQFTKINLTTVEIDTHTAWDPTNFWWTVPAGQGGIYRIEMKYRLKDNATTEMSHGIGAGTVAQDEPSFFWSTTKNATQDDRHGILNQRILSLDAGDNVMLFCYFDAGGSQDLLSAEMTIERLR